MFLRGKPLPATPAKRVVHIQAELGKGAAGLWLDHARQACLGGPVKPAVAHARVLQAVRARLPRLRPVKHQDADAAHAA